MGFVGALMSGGGISFTLAMAGICIMAMAGAYFTITNRAYDGAPIMLGCAVGVGVTVLLYHFFLPLFGQETEPAEGLRLYTLYVAPSLLLFLASVLAYRLRDTQRATTGDNGPSRR